MGHRMPPIAFSLTDPRCHGNEIWNKIGCNSACVKKFCEIFVFIAEFTRMSHRMLPIVFPLPTSIANYVNEIWDKIGYNSACVKDICEIFDICGEFSEMGHQMLLTEFYPDRPLLPWQQNLRQNGLYLGLYNKYHQDPCISRRCGLRVWQFDDVS